MNADNTLLKMNSVIEKFGYKFIFVKLDELEEKFSDLFNLPSNFIPTATVDVGGLIISREFCNVLQSDQNFGFHIFHNKGVLFLKFLAGTEQKIINNQADVSDTIGLSMQFQRFTESCIWQLRLLKDGDGYSPFHFYISSDSRKVAHRFSGKIIHTYENKKLTITDSDIEKLRISFKENFEANKLTDFALTNFNVSYKILDSKIKFVTLMTCLESLLNRGKDQISHIISRHTALIISSNKQDFKTNYKKIRDLYDHRSKIVHGDNNSKKPKNQTELENLTSELQNIVRMVINYCLSSGYADKDDLFNYLNAKGFEG